MAVKTFTSEILTSSDTNTYLANSGLVYVSSTTVGSAVSSVTVSNCFTSTYDNYKIIYSGGVGSTTGELRLTMNNGTASWYGSLIYGVYNANSVFGLGTNNAANYPYAGGYDTSFVAVDMDVLQPFSSSYSTVVMGVFHGNLSLGTFNARHAVLASQTGIVLTTSAGTMTGGTITVYGYRKA